MTRLNRKTRQQEDTLHLQEASAAAVRTLAEQGLPMPLRPQHQPPQMPEDLTEIADKELMVLFSQMTAWVEYANVQVAAAEVDERYLDVQLERARARAIGGSSEKSVTARKAAAGEDSGVQDAQEVRDTAHAYRKLVMALHENLDRNTILLSREITRRVGRDPRASRADKAGS